MKRKSPKKRIRELVAEELRRRASLGGKATLRRHGSRFFSEIGKKGRKAIHSP